MPDALEHYDDFGDAGAVTVLAAAFVRSPAAKRYQALAALGYGNTEALKAVRQVEITENMNVEDMLKQALKYMMF